MEWSLSDLRDVADVLESGEYYLEANVIRKFASDVADLAERVLPRLRQLGYRISTEEGETICQEEIPSLDNLIAELEQIVEASA